MVTTRLLFSRRSTFRGGGGIQHLPQVGVWTHPDPKISHSYETYQNFPGFRPPDPGSAFRPKIGKAVLGHPNTRSVKRSLVTIVPNFNISYCHLCHSLALHPLRRWGGGKAWLPPFGLKQTHKRQIMVPLGRPLAPDHVCSPKAVLGRMAGLKVCQLCWESCLQWFRG